MRKFFIFSVITCVLEANQMMQSLHFMIIYTLSIEILLAERIFFTTMQFLVIFLKSRLNQQVFLYFLDSYALFVLLITKNIFQESDAQAKPFLANVITIAVCYS